MIVLQESVRKCEGFDRILGREEMYAKRIVLPILAWFFKPYAEVSVATIDSRAAESTEPGDTRWCGCGWCASCPPSPSSICFRLCDMRSKPMKSKKTDMAKPARTSARCRPKGCRIEERFQTSKLQSTSTATQIVADTASKNMRWERAVRARDPAAEYRTYIATRA